MKKTVFFAWLILAMVTIGYNANAVSTSTSGSTATSPSGTTESPVPFTKLNSAVDEFKNLSKKEKRNRVKEVKKEIKKYKSEKRSGAEPSTNTLLLVILALLLPPLAVYLHEGEANNKFWISLILTLLFFIPGVIYALIVVLGDN